MKKPKHKRSNKEQKLCEMYEAQIDLKYRKFWYKFFDDNIPYKPFYENYPHQYSTNEDVYVYFGFFKPQRHEYVIMHKYPSSQQFFHKITVTEARQEEISIMTKDYTRNVVERVFQKEVSVFAPWKLDNNKEIVSGFKKDISRWKVSRFVKDETDFNNVIKIMENHVMYLKTVYIMLISGSNFPAITWNDFTIFVSS